MEKQKPSIRFAGFTGDWEQRKLGELVEFYNGDRSSRYPNDNDIVSEGVPFINAGDLVSGRVKLDTANKITGKKFNELSGAKIQRGDIIYCLRGTLGKNAFVDNFDTGTVASSLVDIRPKKIIGKYLFQVLNSDIEYRQRTLNDEGAAQPNLSAKNLSLFDIPMPNKAEQEKIAAYFEHLDNLITLHQRKVEKLQRMKKAMLEKMFPQAGALVPEIRFAGFTGDWERCKVSEVAEIYAGGTPSTGIDRYWYPKEIPWLSSGEVHKKYITYTDNKISVEGMNNSSARMIPKNSVLIALAGQGKTRGTVAINRIPLTTNQSIAAMTFSEEIVPEFVFSNLENRYEEIRRMSSGDGSRGGLNKQLVGNIEIPYTSKEEQQKIGAFFEALDNAVTLHQRKVEKLQRMKKAMLEKMFV